MTKEGRLARGKANYESGKKKLLNNSETQEYIATLPKETPKEEPKEEVKDVKPKSRRTLS